MSWAAITICSTRLHQSIRDFPASPFDAFLVDQVTSCYRKPLSSAGVTIKIIRAILQDEHAILAVSSRVPESLGLGDVSLSLPSIVDRNGIARVLSVPLINWEWKALEASAEVIKRGIAVLAETKPM